MAAPRPPGLVRALLRGGPVDNTGSTARDHLANERTFLAWCRTGIGFVSAGAGLFSVYDLSKDSDIASAGGKGKAAATDGMTPGDRKLRNVRIASGCLVGNGAMLLGFATVKYYRNFLALTQDKFYPNKLGLVGVMAAVATSTATALHFIAKDVADQ